MTREQIEKAGRDYALDQLGIVGLPGRAEAMKAFISGAQWLADRLCHLPLDKVVQELAEYINQRKEEKK